MPFKPFQRKALRPKRWSPGDPQKRATMSYSGGGGEKGGGEEGGTPDAMSETPTLDQISSNVEGVTDLRPVNTSPVTSVASQRGDNRRLSPPVGGGGVPRFSVGNSRNGTIDLSSILGPRQNPNYDPNNPDSTELPYKSGGFFRRMFGDTGNQLNQQYVAGRNADIQGQRYEQQIYDRTNSDQWNKLKAQLDMQAATAQLHSGTQLQERQMQIGAEQAKDEERRANEIATKTGTWDPIAQQDILRRNAQMESARRGVEPGSGMTMVWDEPSQKFRMFSQVGATPGGISLSPTGEIVSTQPIPAHQEEFNPDAPSSRGPSVPQAPGRIDPALLSKFRESISQPKPTPAPAAPAVNPAVGGLVMPQGFQSTNAQTPVRPPAISLDQFPSSAPNPWQSLLKNEPALPTSAQRPANPNAAVQTWLDQILGRLPRQ